MFLRKYNTLLVTGTTAIRIPIIKRGVVDFAVGADYSPAAGDVKVFVDAAGVANITNLPTAIASGNTAQWEFILTAAELSCKQLLVMISDSATKAVEDQCFIVETYGNASAMYAADLSLANLPANVTQLLGTAWLTPTVAGTPDVNSKQLGGTAQTGRDVGASVLLSTGTGTGQLDVTSGVVKSSLVQILGTAISGTASQISAAFTKFFDKATPTGTINSLPDAVAGATNGLFIAGTNAATAITTGLTTTFTGNLTGSVNSVTGLTAATVHSDLDDIQARLPAALTANGNMKSSLVEILTTALTETVGQIAAAFKQFFDVGTPTGTMKAITNVVTTTNLTTNNDKTGYTASTVSDKTGYTLSQGFPTNFSDLAITVTTGKVTVGTNSDKTGYTASTVSDKTGYSLSSTQAFNLTGDITGNLSGSVGSLTTNNDKTGYSIGTGGITTTSFAAGAIDAASLAADATTEITAGIRIKKNTALSNFMFLMVDSTDHVTPKTGLTITATRSIDGAAFAACANSATEVANGMYKINLAATDLNGDVITLRFTGTAADARLITIVTTT